MAVKQSGTLPREQLLELIVGFALTGAGVGALTGYSWWDVTHGICAGLLGAGIGAILGQSLVLSTAEMFTTWLVSFAPIFLGYWLGAPHGTVMGLLAALGGLGLGYYGSLSLRKAKAPDETVVITVPAAKPAGATPSSSASSPSPAGPREASEDGGQPPEEAAPQPQKVAPYRASRKKRK